MVDLFGTGTPAAGATGNTLLDIRKRLVQDSGRYDLVVDAAGDNWSDNGADRLINDAQRWLDRQFGYPKEDRWHYALVAAGESLVTFQHARIIKEAWVVSEGSRIRLQKLTLSEMRAVYYPEAESASIDQGVPTYWTAPVLHLTPPFVTENKTSMAAAGYTDLDLLAFGQDALPLRAIYTMPPADQTYTLAVRGAWYSTPLVNDSDRSVWTYEPGLLCAAARREIEVHLHRNSEGRKDFEEYLLSELLHLESDLIAEEIAGPAENAEMEG